ncbi:trafficking protein particle complex subunit 13-like [Sycon ciliatum]|uniref:trafficking protein particle complex subunit 13-like n=1 Tax=Sycon ciliatum TaxID=27933 RepID=UPI0020AE11AD|eukprot:scpid85345/ scgid7295/ UPF0533 protein C5orf44 homolog
MAGQTQRDHLLTLKVMRLTKPALLSSVPVINEPWDMPGSTLESALKADVRTPSGLLRASLGEVLSLPQNFGNIYLGETFSSYICVHNDSQQTVQDVVFKAELQTASQRITVYGNHRGNLVEMVGAASMDDVIQHEVKELGTHILVCTVSYQYQGEKLHFRKFFKFQVMKPLDVKTKFYTVEDGDLFLEAQIQNIMTQPLFLETVALEPSHLYTIQTLKEETDTTAFAEGRARYLADGDTKQVLYRLKPKQVNFARNVSAVGKLDIVWRTNFGERGRLQTSQLQHMISVTPELRLQVLISPSVVSLEQPFDIRVAAINMTEHQMNLRLVLAKLKTGGLLWSGISGKHIGEITPGSQVELTLTALPVVCGLQSIGGVRLTDISCGKTHEFENFAQVFVQDPRSAQLDQVL